MGASIHMPKDDAWMATCYGLVVKQGNGAYVAFHGGGLSLDHEISEVGRHLDDLGINYSKAPDGLSVWEGFFRYSPPGTPEDNWDCSAVGSFRDLTEEEWKVLRAKNNPWPLVRIIEDDKDAT